MKYVKVMLTLLVAATAVLAWVMRPVPPVQVSAPNVVPPNRFDEALGRMIDSIDIKDVPAQDVVRALHDKTGVDIRVDWETFEKSSPSFLRTEHVTFSLTHVTLCDALDRVFNRDASGGRNGGRYVGFTSFGNTVEVRGDAPPSSGMIMRAYDVRDLLSDDYWGVKTPSGAETETQNARTRDLIDLVGNYVGSGVNDITFSGIPQGGHMESFGGRLMVTQTAVGHQCVANVLAWLRKLR